MLSYSVETCNERIYKFVIMKKIYKHTLCLYRQYNGNAQYILEVFILVQSLSER